GPARVRVRAACNRGSPCRAGGRRPGRQGDPRAALEDRAPRHAGRRGVSRGQGKPRAVIWGRAVTFVNARPMGTLRFGSRILAIGEPPRIGDTVVDLDGAFVLPGLVNAHDHLELNHYGRLKFRETHENASD